MRPHDTSEDAWRYVEEGLRRMTPAERVQRAVSLTIMTHALALAQIRRQFPNEDERSGVCASLRARRIPR
jgi:hypothetical protein